MRIYKKEFNFFKDFPKYKESTELFVKTVLYLER